MASTSWEEEKAQLFSKWNEAKEAWQEKIEQLTQEIINERQFHEDEKAALGSELKVLLVEKLSLRRELDRLLVGTIPEPNINISNAANNNNHHNHRSQNATQPVTVFMSPIPISKLRSGFNDNNLNLSNNSNSGNGNSEIQAWIDRNFAAGSPDAVSELHAIADELSRAKMTLARDLQDARDELALVQGQLQRVRSEQPWDEERLELEQIRDNLQIEIVNIVQSHEKETAGLRHQLEQGTTERKALKEQIRSLEDMNEELQQELEALLKSVRLLKQNTSTSTGLHSLLHGDENGGSNLVPHHHHNHQSGSVSPRAGDHDISQAGSPAHVSSSMVRLSPSSSRPSTQNITMNGIYDEKWDIEILRRELVREHAARVSAERELNKLRTKWQTELRDNKVMIANSEKILSEQRQQHLKEKRSLIEEWERRAAALQQTMALLIQVREASSVLPQSQQSSGSVLATSTHPAVTTALQQPITLAAMFPQTPR